VLQRGLLQSGERYFTCSGLFYRLHAKENGIVKLLLKLEQGRLVLSRDLIKLNWMEVEIHKLYLLDESLVGNGNK